jgi:hypothetical protein
MVRPHDAASGANSNALLALRISFCERWEVVRNPRLQMRVLALVIVSAAALVPGASATTVDVIASGTTVGTPV